MGISLKTHKLLWGKSGSICAFPDCKRELVIDETETDDPSLIGEEAHIVARKPDGPRGESDLTPEERDYYNNLILLCSIHHKQVDDQNKEFTVEKLNDFKRQHESWVRKNLSIDKSKEKDDLLYATYVDKFIELAEVNNWKGWTSFVFGGGQPSIYHSNLRKLRELIEYIISRVWPGRYAGLEGAFHNFKNVSNDFLSVFEKYSERPENSERENSEDFIIWTRKFYHISEWNPEKYEALFKKFEYQCLLVEDLALEMTRAANYLFEQVREHVFSGFRLEEGVLLIEMGPFMDMSYKTLRVEYKPEEKETLYPRLKDFMSQRETRDFSRGTGVSEDYFFKYE